jgi:predicted phage terminase large subunit-like protein
MDRNEQIFFKEMARKDLLSFCVYTDKFFDIIEHHEIIADALHRLHMWEISNLMICMPPRAWKSRIMQEFIAYLYGIQPMTDILYTWHSLSLLEDFSRNIRWRIQSDEYKQVFDSRIAWDNSAVKSWKINKGWVFSIFWVWGWITWKGWNYMIIDDPYASRQDAESDTVRRTVSNWYWSTFLSRKQNDKAKQIIIMQRWREDDLIWEILEKEWDKWELLKIPALNEKWESFWKDRFSKEYFENLKQQSPLFFMSQYQQEPINAWSGDFTREYFQYSEVLPPELDIVTFIDPAISQKQEADNTAIVTIWLDRRSNNIYVLEVLSWKMLPDKIIDNVFQMYLKWKPARVGIEVVAYQKMLALEIRKQMNIRNIFFTLDEISPQGEKEARIRTILQPRYSNHSIYHNNTCTDLELELLKFPNGKHDDMIDALAWAVNMLNTFKIWAVTKQIYTPDYI